MLFDSVKDCVVAAYLAMKISEVFIE